jgi:hypothetical protein
MAFVHYSKCLKGRKFPKSLPECFGPETGSRCCIKGAGATGCFATVMDQITGTYAHNISHARENSLLHVVRMTSPGCA